MVLALVGGADSRSACPKELAGTASHAHNTRSETNSMNDRSRIREGHEHDDLGDLGTTAFGD